MAKKSRGRVQQVSPGERVRILHLVSDSVPQDIRFTAAHSDAPADHPIEGVVTVKRTGFLGPRSETLPLQRENRVHKGMFDVVFSLYVTVEQPTTIAFQTRHFRSKWLLFAILLVLLLGIAAGLPAMLAS